MGNTTILTNLFAHTVTPTLFPGHSRDKMGYAERLQPPLPPASPQYWVQTYTRHDPDAVLQGKTYNSKVLAFLYDIDINEM